MTGTKNLRSAKFRLNCLAANVYTFAMGRKPLDQGC
jgi:hypothetical protein